MGSLRGYYGLLHVSWILVREGVVSSLPSQGLPPMLAFIKKIIGYLARRNVKDSDQKDRLARAVERLGPSYVKVGQFLATRPDIVGKKIADDLSFLQDRMDFFSMDSAKSFVEATLGHSIEELYYDFGEPIAAASIAQVHPATIKTSEGLKKVAVKIIRPGVRQRFFQDLQVMYLVAHMQERFIPSIRRLRPIEVTRTLEKSTKIEMDLRLEAAALSEIAENTAQDKGFRFPKVDWERTGRDVITMEWIDGIRISDIEGLRIAGYNLEHLSATLIQSFLRHTLRDGFFHADMHPGNLFVDPQGVIVAVDMGITGRLSEKERRFLAEILYGFISRDYQRVANVHFEAGYVPSHHNPASFAQAIRAIGEPIHGQSAESISMGKLLTVLFEITEFFDMATRPELILLQKTMVVVEGVARMLNPKFNMWQTSEPVVTDWIYNHLGPKSVVTDLKGGIKTVLKFAQMAPEISVKTEKFSQAVIDITEKVLHSDLKKETQSSAIRTFYHLSLQLALWIIAVSLACMVIYSQ
ncbi:Ubiquinone biosynthesis monooxygenase UbiB [Liberibacter crescens BT-1]|uniref:Ubiquinone biosynthesis monooxygenase UbiB n=1 Tax=Liberibacter crescens (strain BT-1) TaxID=1215343 RepID=L0EWF7_LIBCB|nr:2-polyprenylphenol 6-hydroxylase [Liberibacter crescens]AGA65180.1 Ubiquinone biosynthesis monooxygenase UbiB [Liberibacter crescens BT-1]AMC13137.1 2-polyprenylphenol hydroxylase [Liberibacter crescens]